MHKCLRIMAELDGPETLAELKKSQDSILRDQSTNKMSIDNNGVSGPVSEGSKELKSRDRKRITAEINQSKYNGWSMDIEMLAVLELVGLYSDVNQEIIDKTLHPISRYFVSATEEIRAIREKLVALPLIAPSTNEGETRNPRFESIWNFYRKDLVEDGVQTEPCFTSLPKIPSTPENLSVIS